MRETTSAHVHVGYFAIYDSTNLTWATSLVHLLLFDHFWCKLEGRVDKDDKDLSGRRRKGCKDGSEGPAHQVPDDSVVVNFGQVRFQVFRQRVKMEVVGAQPESVSQERRSDNKNPGLCVSAQGG